MLSIENPPPDPPSCSCQFPQVNSSSDERASSLKQKQQQQLIPLPAEVDLPNSPPPLDHHHHNNTPLSNFSIRDYVLTARSKDIQKNWPFSLKNLQLCLKHGVKDVLPPFQPLDTVRKLSIERCTVESTSLEKQKADSFDKEPAKTDYHVELNSSDVAQSHDKLAESCVDVSSCRSGEENDFRSTTTSVSQSDIEFVPRNRQLETQALLKPSVEVEAAGNRVTHKTESTSRPLGKKCRLIVKFGGNSDRSSTEDIASNCTSISESMASKICPVCKTFSSSSNTTLNAHIDQCLSVESTPKWTADSKITRHRIKPRKTRLMVDIYETAPHCTLEELDRRNGTSWATVSSLPAQEAEKIENSREGKMQRLSINHPEDAGDVGPVYIDANGTKLRILSKFNDPLPSSNVGEDNGARKLLKGSKACKYISKKKKKRLAQKHQRYLKIAPQSKKILSQRVHISQISGGREGYNGEVKSCDKEQMSMQTKPGDSGTLRPWVCSKRRDFTKKITSQDGHRPFRCKWHLPQDLLVENAQSVLNDSPSGVNHVRRFTNLSENLKFPPGKNERVENASHKAQLSNKVEESPWGKGPESLLVGACINDNVERSSPPMKRKGNRLSKDGTFIQDRCMLRSPTSLRSHVSSLSKKKVNSQGDTMNNHNIAPFVSKKSSMSSRAIVSKALKFSSFRKNVLSVTGRSSVIESRHCNNEKCSARKKSQLHFMAERDKALMVRDSDTDQQGALAHDNAENQFDGEDTTDEMPLERSTILETLQKRGSLCISLREKALALNGIESVPLCYGPNEGVDKDCSVRVGDEFPCDIDCLDYARDQTQVHGKVIANEPSSKTFEVSGSRSVETELYQPNNSSKVHSNSLRSIESYGGILCGTEALISPTEPCLVNSQDMFSADEVSDGLIGQNTEAGVTMDSEIGTGNSFPEVDPIPIPGPPGSFLPSPRDMGSEDFQGNSSLTTSRVHSSLDQHDVVDRDSSDSPISAASTISNSMPGRSDYGYSEPSSIVGPYAVQGNMMPGLMAASIEPPLQNASAVSRPTSTGGERTAFDGEYLKLDRISVEKGSLSFKNDQPCCCQRKERLFQGVVSNHQESQLLKRRKMAPVTISAVAKQANCNLNTRPINLDIRTELASQSSCPTSGSEKVVVSVIKPSAGPILCEDSPSAGVRFVARADCDSASPSTSNPILRLMGKDLMVVNKEDDASVPLGQVQPRAPNNQQTSQFLSFSTISPDKTHIQDTCSFPHMASQGSVIFAGDPLLRNPHGTAGQCFDVRSSNSFRSHSDMKLPQSHVQLPAGMFREHCPDGDFAVSMEANQYKGDYNFPSRQARPKNRITGVPLYNTENLVATPDHCRHMDSSAHPVKEVIVIDDVPEKEDVISDVARYNEGWRESHIISSGISISGAPNYNLGRVHPFPCYQSQEHPLFGEAPMASNASFHATSTVPAKTSPVRWGCTSEGSILLQRSSFTAAQSSSGHRRSPAVYYSPSFS